MSAKRFIAIDLGATSGRIMLSTLKQDRIDIVEKFRFPNKILNEDNHLYWDLQYLFNNIIEGLKVIATENQTVESIGVDTWGVDYVIVDKNGEIKGNPFCYRDPHTINVLDEFFNKISKEKLYELTGIQVMNINSIFQLYAIKRNTDLLDSDSKILFMPDAVSYLLTNKMSAEYTIASTSQLLNAKSHDFDDELLNIVGIERKNFPEIVYPGNDLGSLSKDMQTKTGLGAVEVINIAGHDTASAIFSIPATDKNFAFLCSGTWSLMGIETDHPIINEMSRLNNFTNEGGVDGKNCYLRNICGMWILEQCRKEWGEEYTYMKLIEDVKKTEPFKYFINPDAACFASPSSMLAAIHEYFKQTGQTDTDNVGEIARCIFESMAMKYKDVLLYLNSLEGVNIERLYILGGGSKNVMLNQFISNSLGVKVVKGSEEASSLGNVLMQAKSLDIISSVEQARIIMKNSTEYIEYVPQNQEQWNVAYDKYKTLYKL